MDGFSQDPTCSNNILDFLIQWDCQGPPIKGPLYLVSFPYYSHTVRETYHKEVPLLGVPGITLDIPCPCQTFICAPCPSRRVIGVVIFLHVVVWFVQLVVSCRFIFHRLWWLWEGAPHLLVRTLWVFRHVPRPLLHLKGPAKSAMTWCRSRSFWIEAMTKE